MNLVEEIKTLEEKIESYKQKIKELNDSLINVNNIKTNDIDFKYVAQSMIFLNQRIKSAESLLNDYYKKEKR